MERERERGRLLEENMRHNILLIMRYKLIKQTGRNSKKEPGKILNSLKSNNSRIPHTKMTKYIMS